MTALLLAMDTSSPRGVLAVGAWPPGPSPLASACWDDRANQTSAVLLERIHDCVARAGGRAGDVAAVACGRGPGTFTGTRVALATAKGVALGQGCPLLGLSTLAALAASAGRDGAGLVALDARRGEVYAGTFKVHGQGATLEPLAPERCCPLDRACSDVGSPIDFLGGPGVDAQAGRLPPALAGRALADLAITPGGLWMAARAAADTAASSPGTEAVDPVYLRRSYAELGLNRPKRPVYRSPFMDDA